MLCLFSLGLFGHVFRMSCHRYSTPSYHHHLLIWTIHGILLPCLCWCFGRGYNYFDSCFRPCSDSHESPTGPSSSKRHKRRRRRGCYGRYAYKLRAFDHYQWSKGQYVGQSPKSTCCSGRHSRSRMPLTSTRTESQHVDHVDYPSCLSTSPVPSSHSLFHRLYERSSSWLRSRYHLLGHFLSDCNPQEGVDDGLELVARPLPRSDNNGVSQSVGKPRSGRNGRTVTSVRFKSGRIVSPNHTSAHT